MSAAVALETSTRSPTVALRTAGRVWSAELDAERPHASDLLPALDRLLGRAGLSPGKIEAVAVGIGPGSYTGLRVGVATAAAIARAARASLVAVPSGEGVAWAQLAPGQSALHLLDARSCMLYAARYQRLSGDVQVLLSPRVVSPEEARGLLDSGDVLFADEGALRAVPALAPEAFRSEAPRPRARPLLELALRRLERGVQHDPSRVEPLYLRPFGAPPARR